MTTHHLIEIELVGSPARLQDTVDRADHRYKIVARSVALLWVDGVQYTQDKTNGKDPTTSIEVYRNSSASRDPGTQISHGK